MASATAGAYDARQVAATLCSPCHAEDGNSAIPNFPKIAGRRASYLTKQLNDFLAGKRKSDAMVPTLAWEQFQYSKNHTAGIGLRRDFKTAKLDVAYSYTMGRKTTDYTYNAAALGYTAAQVALIGTGTPESQFGQNTLEANLSYPINKTMAVRLYYRYERGKIIDWHYGGVRANPVPAANAVYLDSGPTSYKANTVGLFLRVEL